MQCYLNEAINSQITPTQTKYNVSIKSNSTIFYDNDFVRTTDTSNRTPPCYKRRNILSMNI